MDKNQLVLGGILTLAGVLLFGFAAHTCGEYQTKRLEVQKVCLEGGRTPLECGVVRIVD